MTTEVSLDLEKTPKFEALIAKSALIRQRTRLRKGLRDSVGNAAYGDHAENAGGIPGCVILASQLVIPELAALLLHREVNLVHFKLRRFHGHVMARSWFHTF